MADSANALTDFQPNLTMETSPVQQPSIDPVAKPTPIRFSVPAMPHDTGLDDLAKGLSQFDAGIEGYLNQKAEKQNQADALQAQADFQSNHAQGYSDAVAAGRVPAQASLAYVNSYKQAQGTLAGQQLEQKFQVAYENWPGKGIVDDGGAAYNKFASDFVAANVGTNDPAVLKGLLPVLHEVATNGLRQHITDVDTTLKQGFSDTQNAVVNNGIAAAVAYANTSGNPVSPDYIAKTVGDSYTQARSVGVSDDQAQKNAIVQITTAALLNKAHHGDEILKALDVPLPGSGLVLSQTPYGAEQKLKATNDLETYQREQELQSQRRLTEQNKASLAVVETRVLEGVSKDPTAPVSEDDLKEGSKYDPTFRDRVMKWQKGFTEAGAVSDPQGLINLHRDIMMGGGPDAVTHAMDTGVIKSIKDLQEANREVEEHAKAVPVMGNLTNSEPYKSIISTIKMQTKATGAEDPFGSSGMSPAGLGLQYELNKQMQEWAAANPGATNAQTQEQFAKVSAGILKLIPVPATPQTPMGGPVALPPGNPYAQPQQGAPQPSTPPTAAAANPGQPPITTSNPGTTITATPSSTTASPTTALGAAPPASGTSAPTTTTTGAPPSATQAPPASSPSVSAPPTSSAATPDRATVQAWVGTLSAAQQSNMLKAAARTGKTVDQVAAEGYQAALAKGLIPGAKPPQSPQNPVAFGGLTSSDLSTPVPPAGTQYQPGAAEQFGDAIAKWRASDPNAEAVIHQLAGVLQGMHSALPYQGSTTLAAIKDNPQAAKLLDFVAGPESGGNYNAYYGHPNSTADLSKLTLNEVLQFQHNLVHVEGLPSSATGRYQFMPATLQGLIKQMGLTGNERFTPEMQDNLALQLLKNRGLEQWQQGKLSDAGFMNNLAYEWASLPNPHTGSSQYAGDGLNKSLVTPSQVQAMLNGARGLPNSAPTTPGATPSLPIPISAAPPPAISQPSAPANSAASDPSKLVYFGDSIANIAKQAGKGVDGDVKDGRSPADTFKAIQASTVPLAGRTVVLSMASNNVGDQRSIEKSIDLLVSRGVKPADIKLVGVGDFTAAKEADLNDKLQALAAKKGVTWTGPLDTGNLRPDHVHPSDGAAFLAKVLGAGQPSQVVAHEPADAEDGQNE